MSDLRAISTDALLEKRANLLKIVAEYEDALTVTNSFLYTAVYTSLINKNMRKIHHIEAELSYRGESLD